MIKEYLMLDQELDLVLIDGDLSKDVTAIRNMEIVFKNGIAVVVIVVVDDD